MNVPAKTDIPSKLISELIEEDEDMREIVEEFVDGLAERLDDLCKSYETGDWDRLRTIAHQLKGAGGSYGYPQLSDLGRQMETDFIARQGDQFENFAQQLREMTAAARAGLED